MNVVTKPCVKVDAMDLTLGKPIFADDFAPADCLIIKLIRSPHAFAKVVSFNVKAAEKIKGVVKIYTCFDVPKLYYSNSGAPFPEGSPLDKRIATDIPAYCGDVVGFVAAETEEAAAMAVSLVRVEYEILTPIFDPAESAKGEIIIHPDEDVICLSERNRFDRLHNQVAKVERIWNDVDSVMSQCEVTVEDTFEMQAQSHCMLETHRAYAFIDMRKNVVIVGPMQSPHHVARVVARATGIPHKKIIAQKVNVGGAFGGKNGLTGEIFAAFVAWDTGRPAKCVFERYESFACATTRHAMKLHIKLGADSSGIIKAVDMNVITDSGAYGEATASVISCGCSNTLPIYSKVEAIRYINSAYYTNKVAAGALRGFGATQTAFALGSAVSELAEKLNIDITEIQQKNIICVGDCHPYLGVGSPEKPEMLLATSLPQCIERGKKLIDWEQKITPQKLDEHTIRAVGMSVAMHCSSTAGFDKADAEIRLNYDGTFTLFTSGADLGTGSNTVLMQIAGEALHTPIEDIHHINGNTVICTYDKGAYSSSTIFATGNSVKKAADSLYKKLLDVAAKKLETSPETLSTDDGIIHTPDYAQQISVYDIAQYVASVFSGLPQLSAVGTFLGEACPPPFVACFAEVEVDIETGKVKLDKIVCVADCGRVLNPLTCRAQLEGGIGMGIGLAMFEDVHYSPSGKLQTNSFMQYKMPCMEDVPEVVVEFIDSIEPSGPFGAKSLGEVSLHSPPAAICDAVNRACGVRVKNLPITPEKVLNGLRNKGGVT